MFIGSKGRLFRRSVDILAYPYKGIFKPTERLSLIIEAYPPDKRKRDIDNIIKSLMDSLQHAGLFEDDNQIDFLQVERKMPLLGKVIVTLTQKGMSELPNVCS